MAKAKHYDSYDEDAQPKPKVSVLTLILCFLNVAAAGGFVYLLAMDLEKRQAWSYAVFLHDIAIMGLPLQEEEDIVTGSREVRPKTQLPSDQLIAAFKERKGVGTIKEFQAVDEVMQARILPSHLNDDNLKDIFGSLGEPVNTLEKEVARVREKIFDDIANAAKELAAAEKTESERRQKLAKLLLPLACNASQVRALDKRIRETSPAELDRELTDAATRRMLVDILQPLEMNRPGDIETTHMEKIGDLNKIKIEDLENMLKKRLDNVVEAKFDPAVFHGKDWEASQRDSIEKRRAIAFLLFAVAHVNKPDAAPLYAKGPDRAQVVLGLHEFAVAALAYTEAMQVLERRVLTLIQGEREGNLTETAAGATERTSGFVDHYTRVVQDLKEIVGKIDQAQKRVADLKDQQQKAQKNYEDREAHLKDIAKKIGEERIRTKILFDQANVVRKSLFQAQVELADAAEINRRLNRELRIREGLPVPPGDEP